jgi:hypothetical protein
MKNWNIKVGTIPWGSLTTRDIPKVDDRLHLRRRLRGNQSTYVVIPTADRESRLLRVTYVNLDMHHLRLEYTAF